MYVNAFFFRKDRQLKKIDLDEIVYLEASKNYTKLHTAGPTYLARITLVEALKLLPENKFLRVHRSFAVAADHIDVVARDTVHLATLPVQVPVGRLYYGTFTKQLIILDSADMEPGNRKMMPARERSR